MGPTLKRIQVAGAAFFVVAVAGVWSGTSYADHGNSDLVLDLNRPALVDTDGPPTNEIISSVADAWIETFQKADGFANFVVRARENTLAVYFKNGHAPPADLVRGLNASAAKAKIRVDYSSSAMSLTDANLAKVRVHEAARRSGLTIYGLGPADDYSSLFAEIDPKVARDSVAAERVMRTLSDAAGVPVAIAEGSPTIDSAPATGAGSTPTPRAVPYPWSVHLDAQTARALSADGVTFKPSASQMARIAAKDAVT